MLSRESIPGLPGDQESWTFPIPVFPRMKRPGIPAEWERAISSVAVDWVGMDVLVKFCDTKSKRS